ncbi:hypothetical protein [Halomonas nitroreducens]|uniref:Uncharacterized protein n=1 Tax=Halomonas nitroreducens TaxID=447425 RepID=A0A431V1F8_9GAMM|nr:hypothetical protein [Halomonas nitroreducens]RTR01976.1 hypothetical protein EKG36_13285 [Halomonas nitroreducens]
MTPQRNADEFAVFVSFNVEKLTETLNARADRFCTFLLILLGSAVFGSMADTFWLGFAVASTAAVQFVWRFGEAAGAAGSQKQRYALLLGCMSSLSDSDLAAELERIQEHDSRPLSAIEAIAFNKACLMRGQSDQMKPLPTPARMLAPFIGGHPCGSSLRRGSASSF